MRAIYASQISWTIRPRDKQWPQMKNSSKYLIYIFVFYFIKGKACAPAAVGFADFRDALLGIFPAFFLFFPRIKKAPPILSKGLLNNELAMTYSHMGNPTLPSAQRGFTSEFGKGSGGSLLLLSPAQLFMDLFGSYLLSHALLRTKWVINRLYLSWILSY